MAWIAIGIISMAAGLVQTVTGFGAVVMMMLVLPFFFSVIDASALALTVALVFSVVLCWQYRKHIRLQIALLPTLAYTIINLIVIQVVNRVNAERLETFFAVFLVLLSLYYLLVAKNIRVAPRPAVGIGCGIFSGISAAFFAIGGPPMAIYFMAATDTHYSYVGCMQFLFVVTSITGIIGRITNGMYSASILPYVIWGIVCILGGMWIGKGINDKLNADLMRMLAYLFVGDSGMILLLQNL